MSENPRWALSIMKKIGTTIALTLLLGISGALGHEDRLETAKQAFRRPLMIPFPENAAYSPQMATLGKMLFFDPRLSGAQNLACASCHNPSFGYEVPVAGAIGSANTPLARKANTILNAAWTPLFFWDGRAKDLEAQAVGPITTPAEMNGKFPRDRGAASGRARIPDVVRSPFPRARASRRRTC